VGLHLPADKVWKLIGGFGSLPDWLPYIPKSELADGGRARHLADADGSMIIERLMAFDEKGRRYTYQTFQAPVGGLTVWKAAGRSAILNRCR
jgi:hypothetical protein